MRQHDPYGTGRQGSRVGGILGTRLKGACRLGEESMALTLAFFRKHLGA